MNKKILVVDDEVDLVEILCEELNLLGYETLKAYDGLEALEVIAQKKPNLIISDINMPKLDALHMMEKMNEQGIRVPVILLTAYSNSHKIKKAWELGAFDFIEKPASFDALHALIKDALEFGINIKSLRSEKDLAKTSHIHLPLETDLLNALKQKASSTGITVTELIEKKLKN